MSNARLTPVHRLLEVAIPFSLGTEAKEDIADREMQEVLELDKKRKEQKL